MIIIFNVPIFNISFNRKILIHGLTFKIVIRMINLTLDFLILKSSYELLIIRGIKQWSIIHIQLNIWGNKYMLLITFVHVWYSYLLPWTWCFSFLAYIQIFKLLQIIISPLLYWFYDCIISILLQFNFLFIVLIEILITIFVLIIQTKIWINLKREIYIFRACIFSKCHCIF